MSGKGSRLGLRARGYTMLEVMIALTLVTVGVSGVVAMQKVTTVANRDARSLAIANQIARTWLDRLRTDSVSWNFPSPSMPGGDDLATDTIWLRNVGTAGWFQPETHSPVDGISRGGALFDMHGTDISDLEEPEPFFCTHLRLEWLYGPPPAPPPYLIRAEVRVFWLRDGGSGLPEGMTSVCDPTNDPLAVGAATDSFHFVYATSAIKQNPL